MITKRTAENLTRALLQLAYCESSLSEHTEKIDRDIEYNKRILENKKVEMRIAEEALKA